MKLLIVGDMHFRFQLPYASAIKDGRKSEWEAIKVKIHDTAKDCDAVIFLGDLFNARHNHSSVNREVIEFLKELEDNIKDIYIIAGNHERYGKETALDFLQKANIFGVHVFTEFPKQAIELEDGIKATFLPYITPGVLGVEDLVEANRAVLKLPKSNILFHHHAMSGTKLAGATTDILNEIVLKTEELEKQFDWIFGGHIHGKQRLSPKTIVAGNIMPQEVGDHEKAIWVLDTEKNALEEVLLPVRGIYKVDVDKSMKLGVIPKNSIVKAYVKDRDIDVDIVKEYMSKFDASIIIEQYPSERDKVALENTGVIDLSLDTLLDVYSKARNVSIADLKDGLNLITQ